MSSLTWILQQLPSLPSSGFRPSSTNCLHSRDRFVSITSLLENAGGSQPLHRQTFQVLSHVAPSNHSSLISHIPLYMLSGLTLVGREQSGPWCVFVGLRTCQKSEHFTYTFRCFWTSLEKLDNLATRSPHSNMAHSSVGPSPHRSLMSHTRLAPLVFITFLALQTMDLETLIAL